ncbi:hypothetical protein [Chitinophaga pinensis]|uniref:Uncharacterized protein n=1 Tax=Chitinophaga pinensis TaxID=79329 RepID=A0A5C6LIV9_9BACT|nr:hypothetical protein [Chitinophaga pinensis]TWV93270.1 hypothetical protein FEF09_27325 [Chitinophaga pinensis]
MENDYAIVIGVEYYEGIHPLAGPHGDLERFLAWIKDEAGGNIKDDNIKTFISTPTFTPAG